MTICLFNSRGGSGAFSSFCATGYFILTMRDGRCQCGLMRPNLATVSKQHSIRFLFCTFLIVKAASGAFLSGAGEKVGMAPPAASRASPVFGAMDTFLNACDLSQVGRSSHLVPPCPTTFVSPGRVEKSGRNGPALCIGSLSLNAL